MPRTCDNCDHREVCHEVAIGAGLADGIGKCGNWSGWIQIGEELPKDYKNVVSVDNKGNFYFETNITVLHLSSGKSVYIPVSFAELLKHKRGIKYSDHIVAWRELPKYEVKNERMLRKL